MIGTTVSHYQVLERLGGGGMGVVYKARDLRLERIVALKFLAAHRGAAEEHKRRFIREAKAASSLDHPNICTIHEIGEAEDGALFIAMAFYDGETLSDRIGRGRLPLAEAVDIALQIAAGLARAHEQGIVHRDVKPANVMLTAGGQVKLLDFGVARLADQSRLTRAGTAMGTAAFMSPEQFHGEPAGPEADVWSLGVVLYGMVTGRLPFEEATESAMAQAILKREPRPMSALRIGVPAALERIVARTLKKRPAERYARMEAMRADLRDLAAEVGPPQPADEDRTLLEIPMLPTAPQAVAWEPGLPGSTVGPYEVLEPLGGGGMGVVYKARDTRLDRVVALKFLPPELTRDPEAKQRFMQEARAASALDHPNLCTILEVGETPDGRLYLAMPCYDGETVRGRIERGPLAVDEALEIAEQIARGLAKAHRNGIVHRDIKPANLIVTGDGVVKILDFGLAKLAGSAAISRSGSSAGTPSYMSPEQARGGELDHRTDLWSLGVVLYEMLAGRRPFQGEREQAVIYAILDQPPRPLRAFRPEAPAELERIVERLLAKDPAGRYASSEEVFADLRVLRGEALTGTMVMPQPRSSVRPWMWVAGAVATALGIAGLVLWLRPDGPEPAPGPAKFTRLTDQAGRELFPSLSPDGDYFVYARETAPGNLDIYLQRVGGSNAINLTKDSPVDDTQPAYSPDGKQIAFRSEREGGGIFLMEATGESVRRLAAGGFNPSWSPDGKEILYGTREVENPQGRSSDVSQIWGVEPATGRRRLVVRGDAVQPSWSPNGRRIAYWGMPANTAKRVLFTSRRDGSDPVPAVDDPYLNWNPVWSADGRYLFFASDRSGSMNLWRLPIDEETGRVRGEAEPLTTSSQWSGLLNLSRDGRRMLYATQDRRANLVRMAFDPAGAKAAGPVVPITQGSRNLIFGKVSPDGEWIVFTSLEPQEDLFLVRPDGSGLRQITKDPFKDRGPNWSPDGRIVFFSDRGGRYGVWSIRPDGSELRPLVRSQRSIYQSFISPDGRWLICIAEPGGAALIDLAKPLEQRSPESLPIFGSPQSSFVPFSWSPDGRRLAGMVRGTGIVLYSLASRRYQRLTEQGIFPAWMPDSSRLLYVDGGGIFMIDSLTLEAREVLAPAAGSVFTTLDLSPDGRVLYGIRGEIEGDIWLLSLGGEGS